MMPRQVWVSYTSTLDTPTTTEVPPGIDITSMWEWHPPTICPSSTRRWIAPGRSGGAAAPGPGPGGYHAPALGAHPRLELVGGDVSQFGHRKPSTYEGKGNCATSIAWGDITISVLDLECPATRADWQ
ncbi:MAG: hypothetical protein MI725_01440 [Pirellulales bacterium]|nr:hypothetical protein [Pirellulales bacterium]